MALENLAGELAALRNTRPRNFKDWLAYADPETVSMVMESVMDPRIPANKLAVTLTKNDIPVTRETIGKYRESAQ